MKTLLISAALAAAVLAPAAASAQVVPNAVIAVVDLDRVTAECNACKTAQASLRSQVEAYQTREQTLTTQLDTEQKSIQTAIDALKGKEPDAALKSRAQAWESRRQQDAQELGNQQEQIKRNQAYIQKQIQDKLGPIYQQVMQRRGANVLVESGYTLASAQNVDVTNDILAALNTSLPTLVTTAPAAPTPQGR